MVSDDANADPAASVALVASRLFGTQVTSDAVIGESLERATDPVLKLKTLGGRLAAAVNDEIPDSLSDRAPLTSAFGMDRARNWLGKLKAAFSASSHHGD